MDYIEISFTAELGEIDSDFRRTVDEMFILINPSATHFQQMWRPPVDVCETPDEILVLAEIAGVAREDLRVEIGRRKVKIFGRRREKHIEGNASYCLAEIPYGYFERSLTLLAPIEMGAVSATYTDGLLQIRMPKMSLNKVHKIPIQTG
jgi:HSP20 family protein